MRASTGYFPPLASCEHTLQRDFSRRTAREAGSLGCGDGTTALPLALLGANVTGVDFARNLVEVGNKRAAEAGLKRLKFHEGDACNLEGVNDDSFDLTLSVFGAMFAPKPFDVAKEM